MMRASGEHYMVRHHSNLKVLIVEDDRLHQKILYDSVVNFGHIPYVVPSLEEAFSELKIFGKLDDAFDLIILDLGLPDMDKDDPCRLIREVRTNGDYNKHKDVHILLNTATPKHLGNGAFLAAEYRRIYVTKRAKIIEPDELRNLFSMILRHKT